MKKGILVRSAFWAKHLRPWGKKIQWGKERAAEKKDISTRVKEEQS